MIRVCSGQLWEHRGAQTEEAAEPTSAACEHSTLCVSVCAVSGDLDEKIACYRANYYGHDNDIWGLIYKGIYAQKMAYASFYAMFAIYKILT